MSDMSEQSFAEQAMPGTPAFDEQVQAGVAFLRANPSSREVLRWALVRCSGGLADLFELEDEIRALPIYGTGCPEPFYVLEWLVQAGCMEVFDTDAEGNVVDADALREQGMSEDEIDDLLVGFAYRTNEVGQAVAQAASPANRMKRLIAGHEGSEGAINLALTFFLDGRTLGEFSSYLKDEIGDEEKTRWGALSSPMVLVNKLAETGALAYGNHAWRTTEEGRQLITE